MDHEIIKLSELVKQRNEIGGKISKVIDRPETIGHAGEYIAGKIFDIRLEESASKKAIDGFFRSGSLSNKSVNVKWYGKQESILDITPDSLPDYYLVLTGPKSTALSSKGDIRTWLIEFDYLFDAENLVEEFFRKNLKIGVATSVRQIYWKEAEIYPRQINQAMLLSVKQRQMLDLFGMG